MEEYLRHQNHGERKRVLYYDDEKTIEIYIVLQKVMSSVQRNGNRLIMLVLIEENVVRKLPNRLTARRYISYSVFNQRE